MHRTAGPSETYRFRGIAKGMGDTGGASGGAQDACFACYQTTCIELNRQAYLFVLVSISLQELVN